MIVHREGKLNDYLLGWVFQCLIFLLFLRVRFSCYNSIQLHSALKLYNAGFSLTRILAVLPLNPCSGLLKDKQ